MTAKSRSTPSSCEDEVLSFIGQSGQVSSLFSLSGGRWRISIWVTEAAPWRLEVPMQSEPVSPPPMTTTCLSPARIGRTLPSGSSLTRRFCCGRNSMAKWMPSSSRPGMGRSRGFSAPPASTTASCFADQLGDVELDADMDVAVEGDAFRLHLGDAPLDLALLHLEVGDAVAQQPAGLGVLLVDVDVMAGAGKLLGCRRGPPGRSRRRPPTCRSSRPAAAARSSLPSSRGRRWRIRSS